MLWLTITLIAYFLNAVAMVIDKTILKQKIDNAFVYTFYVAALGTLLAILALPLAFVLHWRLVWPGWEQFFISLAAGGAFSLGLIFMYALLKREDASRVIPLIGGLTPLFVLILAFWLVHEHLNARQIAAFVLIISGAWLVSVDIKAGGHWRIKKILFLSVLAAFFFGLSYALTKYVYNHQPFISGFVWTRLGALILAVLAVLYPANLKALLHAPKNKGLSGSTKWRFLFGQSCGGAGAVLIQYAISIASVTLVQALQGTQYVFVFLIVLISTYYFPKFLSERFSRRIILQKSLAILLIAWGIYFIV